MKHRSQTQGGFRAVSRFPSPRLSRRRQGGYTIPGNAIIRRGVPGSPRAVFPRRRGDPASPTSAPPLLRVNQSGHVEPDTPSTPRAPDGAALSAPNSKRQAQPGKSRPVKPRNTPNTRKPRAMKSGSIRWPTEHTEPDGIESSRLPSRSGEAASGGPVKRKKGCTRSRGGRGDQAGQISAPPREPL